MKTKIFIVFFLFGFISAIRASNGNGRQSHSILKNSNRKIIIDGQLDDKEWGDIKELSKFINKWPIDSGEAQMQTSVKITYDDNFLYVSAINYQKRNEIIIQTLKRDNSSGHWGSDGFSVVIDPINQQSNGFLFGVNAGGAQMEASLNVEGSITQFDENWDNKWYSATKVYDDYWITEMAIPFNSIRFSTDNRIWGINFVRNDMKNNVYSTWAQVPLAFPGIDLGHMGTMQWEHAPKQRKGNYIIIPYLAGSIQKDYEESTSQKLAGDVGLDAKISITSSLNLDLTINPDFSNIDVDRQVTNLTRFNLFFPEKRGFFLENSDLFSNYGTWGITPFFSRKIGLEDGNPIPILFGGRLSGNLNDQLRIGVMDVQTKSTKKIAANNYFVTSIQHQVGSRSRIKALVTNWQGFQHSETGSSDDFNRTTGLEFDYVSDNGYLTGTGKYHASFSPEKFNENDYYNAGISYDNGQFFGSVNFNRVGDNYIPEMGFVPGLNHYDPINDTTVRIGFTRLNSWIGYNIRPKNGKINSHTLNPWVTFTYDNDGGILGRNIGFWYQMQTQSRNEFTFNIRKQDASLIVPADLIDGEEPVPINFYHNNFSEALWSSDSRKTISGSIGLGGGEFYTGYRTEVTSSINFRKQPWGNFSINYSQNFVDLTGKYGKTMLHLIGPSTEISFSNKMFWTTFLQYNTQAENFNINSRFQWRFRPMSDFFIVYSENYTTINLKAKNRGLVFKFSYWFNL